MKKYNFIIVVSDPNKPRENSDLFRYEGLSTPDDIKELMNYIEEWRE